MFSVNDGSLLLVCSDLHSYLLGEQEDNETNQPVNNNNNPPHGQPNNNNNPPPAVGEGLHAAHQAILQQGGPVGFQPYHRPVRFPFRVRLHQTLLLLSLYTRGGELKGQI